MDNIIKDLAMVTKEVRQAEVNMVEDIQKSHLADLRDIKAQLARDVANMKPTCSNDQEVAKLEYRVHILTEALREKMENKREKELEEENRKLQYRV